jgi:hypothetical protein
LARPFAAFTAVATASVAFSERGARAAPGSRGSSAVGDARLDGDLAARVASVAGEDADRRARAPQRVEARRVDEARGVARRPHVVEPDVPPSPGSAKGAHARGLGPPRVRFR